MYAGNGLQRCEKRLFLSQDVFLQDLFFHQVKSDVGGPHIHHHHFVLRQPQNPGYCRRHLGEVDLLQNDLVYPKLCFFQ